MSFSVWRTSHTSEINFWSSWINNKGSQNINSKKKEEFKFRMNPSSYLQNYINEILKEYFVLNSTLKILDVGAGPCTYLGKKSASK